MRYVHTNDDGSVGVWACLPLAVVDTDGVRYKVLGLRRPNGRCVLDCGNAEKHLGISIDLGDDTVDVSDITEIPGFTIEWPDFAYIKAKLPPDIGAKVASHRPISRAEIITDRTFRAAWEDTGKIDVNMPKARDIHRDRLRAIRAPLLADLDTQYMRADETGDAILKAEIAAKKQALRDITDDPAIEAAKTPEELKAVRPAILDQAASTMLSIRVPR